MTREELDSLLRQDKMYLRNGCIHHEEFNKPIGFFGISHTYLPLPERTIDWVGHFYAGIPPEIVAHIKTIALIHNIRVNT